MSRPPPTRRRGGHVRHRGTLAEKYFHEIIGIDLDGRAVSAPLIEPSGSSFTSFGGRKQISGDFNKTTAEELAAVLDSGPLAAPLVVAG